MEKEKQKQSFTNEDGSIIAVRTVVIVDMPPDETPFSKQIGVVVDTEYTWSPSDGPVAVQFLETVPDRCFVRSEVERGFRRRDPYEKIYLAKLRMVCFYPHELRPHPNPWEISPALIRRALSQN